MAKFSVQGAELEVELSDEGGHPVVQLHGLTSSRARDRVLNMDLGRGLSGTRLLRYDARGHGESTGRTVVEDYEWQNLADDLLALLHEYFPGEKVYGVGPSMGCATLLYAAIKEPERFCGLTLLLPPTAWESRKAKSQAYLNHARVLETEGWDAFVQADINQPVPPATVGNPVTLPDNSPQLLPTIFRGAAASDLPQLADLARVNVPTHILAWTEDPSHPVTTAQALLYGLTQARLQVASTRDEVNAWPQILMDDVAKHGAPHTAVPIH
ncbi:alpha/beta hydrolase [Glutamicibacter mishrai]|uniref:alpha/beta fold hydrolase n=1 Tax=Glutamicibacter mishrai TaxID=1775880 RepID=UPI0020CFE7D2|nr:alpha/beta hydrolase [Glutamicibacter mishrai]UTT39626.1 alpha/beta hydrolase [Glutamicibacter mishrai]